MNKKVETMRTKTQQIIASNFWCAVKPSPNSSCGGLLPFSQTKLGYQWGY